MWIAALPLLLEACMTAKNFNAQIDKPHSVSELRADVDYVHRKLVSLHPSLYLYISKERLDREFDSLKVSITHPMTANTFYFGLSRVVASVRQGHTRLMPLTPMLSPRQMAKAACNGVSPLARLDLELFGDTLYVVKNDSTKPLLKAGTAIMSADSVTPASLIAEYRGTFTSDGYNTTFTDRLPGKKFAYFLYYRRGFRDSIPCTLRCNDTLRNVWLKPLPAAQNIPKEDMRAVGQANAEKKLRGYDGVTKSYSKTLWFANSDSSVAVMKISDFEKGKYKKFYAESFAKIALAKSKALVIDLRDNTGGQLSDINCLYSYLTDTIAALTDSTEVASRTSLWHVINFRNQTPLTNVVQGILMPLFPAWMVYTYLGTHKAANGKYYCNFMNSRIKPQKNNRFEGKVYVLINGCCFSASSIISAELQGTGRAVFAGSETGGALNGCVAGLMPVFRLPHTKLPLRFGFMRMQPVHHSGKGGRGIFPDVSIVPTLKDRIAGRDPELQWAVDDATGKHTSTSNY
jgi:hypothetical protein